MSNRRCKDHPRYTGKYHPRTKCRTCWKLWRGNNSEKAVRELNKGGLVNLLEGQSITIRFN